MSRPKIDTQVRRFAVDAVVWCGVVWCGVVCLPDSGIYMPTPNAVIQHFAALQWSLSSLA